MAPEPLLVVEGLGKSFGGVRALERLDLTVEAGRVAGLIGPNGSGKTTAFNLISGLIMPDRGRIRLAGRDITRASAAMRSALGLGRTFQNIRLFASLSVADNVAVGCHRRHGRGPLATLMGLTARGERLIRARVIELLERFELGDVAGRPVSELAYGDRRRVEICRALAAAPRLLLLDEPGAGMTPREKATLSVEIGRLASELDMGILLVEHDMLMIAGICQRVHVIAEGALLAEGEPGAIRDDPAVQEAYLGRPRERHLAVA